VADSGIVYLYRHAEGEAPVRRFLDSYMGHSAGIRHDLHVVLKGFPDQGSLAAARALFGSLPINTIEVGDSGYDIGAYFAAARAVANPQLIFLNTFSEVLADNWLAFFDKALGVPGVGLVGATGSWQSGSSGYEAAVFKALSRLRPSHTSKKSDNHHTVRHTAAGAVNMRQVLRNLPRMALYPLRLYQFGRYPNPHIRTNAFMMRRDLFLSLRQTDLKRKIDAYEFESGRRSMTKQVMARGFAPVVVDRCGKHYAWEDWQSSSTFWMNDQPNLLVADNQTRNYATGSAERRRMLEHYAWHRPSAWFK
jgi:hypothetical protein